MLRLYKNTAIKLEADEEACFGDRIRTKEKKDAISGHDRQNKKGDDKSRMRVQDEKISEILGEIS